MKRMVVIIGAGPAGMMAAIKAGTNGADVVLLEKNKQIGKKLAITGKGRGNLTSSADRDEFIASYPGNGRFLYGALNQFSNLDLIQFFESRGLKTRLERGKRIFPESESARDIVRTLQQELIKLGVTIETNEQVKDLLIDNNKIRGVVTAKREIAADAVIIATGGLSYPATGSTGDGYGWAEKAGHTIIDPKPSLVPLEVEETWVKELQGLSLRNIRAEAYDLAGNRINSDFGEMIFTHFGVSGPIILSMSSDISRYIFKKRKKVIITLNLKPALSPEKLDERVRRDLSRYSRRQFKNCLDDLLPRKLIPVIVQLSQISPEKPGGQLTREERKQLLELLQNLRLTVTGTRPVAEAIVTAGGVNVKEVNPKTMESKLVADLYFAGEVLDIDGYTGGFNLQAAFSTGFVAGHNASR